MLADSERKLLRILFNLYRNFPFHPNLEMLCRMSQRNASQVRSAFRALMQQGYVLKTEKGYQVVRERVED